MKQKKSTTILKTRHAFIDTEAFVGKNYSFDSLILSSLKNLAAKGRIHLYTTDITI